MTKILYCKERPYLYIPENIIKYYRASKSISGRFKLNRADQDLIRYIEEYLVLRPEDESAKHISIADIGNATKYVVVDHYGWEAIYTEDELPWRIVGVNDDDEKLILKLQD